MAERVKPQLGGDLFKQLDGLFTKKPLEGSVPLFVMHRFLASDQLYAPAARTLQLDLRRGEPAMVYRVWQGLLPQGTGAPRFSYPAPKKGPEAESLTLRMMQVLSESRLVVEEIQDVITAAGRGRDLYHEYGIVPPQSESHETQSAEPDEFPAPAKGGKKKRSKPAAPAIRPGGLLAE